MVMPAIFAFLISGAVGEGAFEAYAFLLSPLLFGVTLEPANLVTALAARAGVTLSYGQAFALHVAAGALVFPATALAFRAVSGLRNPLTWGFLWGVVLWALAQGGLAPLVGRAPFMGFGAYTQSSFIAHTGFMLVFALVYTALRPRAGGPAQSTA